MTASLSAQADSGPKATKRFLWPYALALLGVIGVGIWFWESELKDRVYPKRWGVVEAGAVYRSGQIAGSLIYPVLAEHGIKVVIDFNGEETDNPDQRAEQRAIRHMNIEGLRYPLRGDGTGNIRSYALGIAAMERARQEGRPVLLHCSAGTQRTGGVVACYRLLVQGRPVEEVVRELRAYDWSEEDNPKLLPYLNENMAELARQLVEMGVIDREPDPLPRLGP
ncbi:MAG: dual specificity protein phosphatase family protein [Phycisphaeraceae bacterium]|nr:dual specificity protein phosphatase family protein [Phycisphaeraceae bacterium]